MFVLLTSQMHPSEHEWVWTLYQKHLEKESACLIGWMRQVVQIRKALYKIQSISVWTEDDAKCACFLRLNMLPGLGHTVVFNDRVDQKSSWSALFDIECMFLCSLFKLIHWLSVFSVFSVNVFVVQDLENSWLQRTLEQQLLTHCREHSEQFYSDRFSAASVRTRAGKLLFEDNISLLLGLLDSSSNYSSLGVVCCICKYCCSSKPD